MQTSQMSVRLVDMDARCKNHDKKKKKFGGHWLFIGIAGTIMYGKKSLSLSLSLTILWANYSFSFIMQKMRFKF